MGVEPVDTTKPRMGRRKALLLGASKENTRDLSPALSREQQNFGRFKLRITCMFMKGLEQRRNQHRLMAKVDRVQVQLIEVIRVNVIIPSPTWVGP